MKNYRVTNSVRTATPRGSAASSVETALRLLAALLLIATVACSETDSGGDPAATAAAAPDSSTPTTPPTGGTPTPPPSTTPAPPPSSNQAPPRAYSMSFLPSASGAVDGYEVSMGASAGNYDTVVDIPLSAIAMTGSVWTYDLTMESDRDYFLVLRAYNAGGMSANSNEIKVDALVASNGIAAPSGGSATTTVQANQSADPASAVVERSTRLAKDGDTATTRDLAEDTSAERERKQQELERERMTSLDFDGLGEHLASSESVALGASYAFSVSMWARPAAGDRAARRTLLDMRDVAGDANRLTVALVDAASVELSLHGSDGSLLHRARFDGVLLGGEWQHVALVFDANTDFEPRLYLDAQPLAASESTSAEGEWAMSDTARRIVIGADATGAGDSFLGQLGHVGVWGAALPDAAIEEVSAAGHAADLRLAGANYSTHESLLHYWRLGADADGIGFDHGNAEAPVDLDDARGGIDGADVVAEAPAMIQLVAR